MPCSFNDFCHFQALTRYWMHNAILLVVSATKLGHGSRFKQAQSTIRPISGRCCVFNSLMRPRPAELPGNAKAYRDICHRNMKRELSQSGDFPLLLGVFIATLKQVQNSEYDAGGQHVKPQEQDDDDRLGVRQSCQHCRYDK